MMVFDSLIVRWFFILTGAVFLQIAFISDFQPFGTHADLLLLVGVCAGVAGGEARGTIIGFISGLLVDLLSVGTLGVTALAFALAGFVVGRISEMLMDASRLVQLGLVALGTLIGVILHLGIATLLGGDGMEHNSVWSSVVVLTVLNTIFAIPVLRIARWAQMPAEPHPRHGMELRRD